jgi:hypothetical protein
MVAVTGFVASAAFAASGRIAFTAGMFMIGVAARQ